MPTKLAQWKTTGTPHSSHHTLTATLRSGKQGMGRDLGHFTYWANSLQSKEASDPIAANIQEKAWDAGYTIQGSWNPAESDEF